MYTPAQKLRASMGLGQKVGAIEMHFGLHTNARCLHVPTGFLNKRRRLPPVPSPVHFHFTFFTPCHFLTGSSVPFNI